MKVRIRISTILTLILAAATAFTLLTSAFAEESHAAESSVTAVMTIGADGSLTVDEQWNIAALDGGVDDLTLTLPLQGDDLLYDRTNLTLSRVSVNRLTATEGETGSAASPGYSASWTDGTLRVTWHLGLTEGQAALLGINYVIPDAVKNYNDSAWCAVELMSPPGSSFRYRNASVSVIFPAQTSADSFSVSDNGNMAATKTTDGLTLSAENIMGKAGAMIQMPLVVFNQGNLALIADTDNGSKAAAVILCLIAVILLAAIIFYMLKYKEVFYRHFEKRAAAASTEVSREEFGEFLKTAPPAQLLAVMMPKMTNESDALAVTFLDFYKRGVIRLGAHSYVAAQTTGLTKFEREALALFTTEKAEIIRDDNRLRAFVKNFNTLIPGPGPFDIFLPSKKLLYTRLFALKRAAKSYNYVSPGEISDGMLRENRYDMFNLFIGLIQESNLRAEGFDAAPKRRSRNDIFLLLRK